jgi:RNA polymerase sigma factor (sigma-70 family)
MKGKPFDAVVAEYGPVMLRMCRVTLSSADADADADDAWSETFLAALRAYPGLPEDANVEAWLVTIAHRKVIDQLRARSRAPVPVRQIPEQADARGMSFIEAAEVLRALPDKQRLAVAYHHLVGLPYAQIAELLGNSEAAARRAGADGIRALRKQLGQSAQLEGSQ